MSRCPAVLASLLALGAATAAGCGDDDAGPPIDVSRPECENLNPAACLAPWPSDRYLVADATTATGKRLRYPREAMPVNSEGIPVDPAPYERFDGFSALSSAMTVVHGPVDTSALAGADRVEASLDPASRTVLLDTSTHTRVAHFAEIDAWADADPTKVSLYVRPAQRLAPRTRYVVAIRALRRPDGTAIEPSPYFAALRDGGGRGVAELDARRAHFEELFTELAAAGVPRGELLEAWDFTTGSDEATYGDLLAMREDALARIGAEGLGCTVTTVETDYQPTEVYLRIRGTFTVPLYMDGIDTGARVNRGPDGRPAYNGTAEAPFVVIVPVSVRERVMAGRGPARLLTFGHGLMGSGWGEASGGYVRGLSNRLELVTVATDMWGMSENDAVTVADSLSQMGGFPRVGERSMQGIINHLVLTRSFAGVCRNLPELQIGGVSPIDPTQKYYLGISQGAIFGLTIATMSPDIDRFVLNVGGISYPIMIPRSVDYPDYRSILGAWYANHLERNLLMLLITPWWDLAEPSTYAPHVLRGDLPGTSAKRVLYQVGANDAQVPNIASDIAARTMGLPLLEGTSTRMPWNVTTTPAPADSAYVIYDLHDPAPPPGSVAPPSDNMAHGGVRELDAAIRQIDRFFQPDGRVEDFCDGPCDPE